MIYRMFKVLYETLNILYLEVIKISVPLQTVYIIYIYMVILYERNWLWSSFRFFACSLSSRKLQAGFTYKFNLLQGIADARPSVYKAASLASMYRLTLIYWGKDCCYSIPTSLSIAYVTHNISNSIFIELLYWTR